MLVLLVNKLLSFTIVAGCTARTIVVLGITNDVWTARNRYGKIGNREFPVIMAYQHGGNEQGIRGRIGVLPGGIP